MKNKSIYPIIALTGLLTACNTNSINPMNPPLTPTYDAKHGAVTVYTDRSEIPQGARIIGHVKAVNKLSNGSKASPEAVMIELKSQAKRAGGIGIIHITPGIAQTTADVVGIR